jgi:tetratricopeptide (TPR) repeat protein
VLFKEFVGTDRYVVRRRLGMGGMGVVYAALDRERGIEVALKVLQQMDEEGILQIKREFRSLAEVSHPNLVGLYELVSAGGTWFFTMDLVEGVDFRSWVRPGGGAAVDLSRVRSTMRQLADAVACIHGAGKLHRDIKPSNVLVTSAGRLVLLDFGLVQPARVRGGRSGSPRGPLVAGTPAYMAPEQAMGRTESAASDWYAVGVMLYEVLVGWLPFSGSAHRMVHEKTVRDPPDPATLVPEGARDLAQLALRLLAREPERRPSAEAVLRALGGGRQPGLIASSMMTETQVPFVGRSQQLAVLRDAHRASARQRPVVVTVRGGSGMGKSALCRQFIDEVRQRGETRTVILEARCYERESVPHKALDGVIDGLAGELQEWPLAERQAVLPEDRKPLERLFPALRRLWPEGSSESVRIETALEARALRRRAALALRALIFRVAERRPLIIHIDDFQWGDAGSGQILADVLSGSDSPPLLWIFSYRQEDEASSEALAALGAALAGSRAEIRPLVVEPLPDEDCRELALRLLERNDAETHQRAEVLAREAAGSPLFVSELVRLERDAGDRAPRDAQAGGGSATLEQLLRTRVALLPEPARRMLVRIAVAGRPLRQRILSRGAGRPDDDPRAIFTLRNANLVRASGMREDDTVESYHDRIRELVVATLSPAETRQTHADLSSALQAVMEASGGELTPADVEATAYHALGAGDEVAALKYSLLAARQARAVYASRDAVRHFEIALGLLRSRSPSPSSSSAATEQELYTVEMEAAEAHRQAGSYGRALEVLTEALSRARDDDQRRVEIYKSRGRVFQEKGDSHAAVADLEKALKLLGRRSPQRPGQLVALITLEVVRRFAGALLGRWWRPARDPAAVERQAEVLFVLIRIYFFVDIGKVVWAGFAAMNLAQRSQRDVTRAMAGGFFGAVLSGMGSRKRGTRHCEEAVALAARSGDRLTEGLALGRLGTVAVFANRLDVACDVLRRSVAALKDVSETWELLTSLMLEATAHFLAGRLARAQELWEEMAALAGDVGVVMHSAWCLSWAPYVRYLRGAVPANQAKRDLERAVVLSQTVHDVANQAAAQSHMAAICVAEGDAPAAARAALRLYRTLSRYRVQVPFLQVGLVNAVEAALLALGTPQEQTTTAAATTATTTSATGRRRRRALQSVVQRSLKRLDSLSRSYPHLRPPTLRAQALAAAHHGQVDRARALALQAVTLLEASPNRLWLLAAYRDAAALLVDHAQRGELLHKAEDLSQALDVVDRRGSSSPALPDVGASCA